MVPTPYAAITIAFWKTALQLDSNEGFSRWKADPEQGVGFGISAAIGGFDFTFAFGWTGAQYR